MKWAANQHKNQIFRGQESVYMLMTHLLQQCMQQEQEIHY